MSVVKKINRLKALDQLIRLKSTGTPNELACRMQLSERQIFRYISDLKELGAQIEFNSDKNSYVYTDDIELHIEYIRKKHEKNHSLT